MSSVRGRQDATHRCVSLIVAVAVLVAFSRLPRRRAEGAGVERPGERSVAVERGQYDVRHGAQAFAPIIGTVGGFAVAAIVLIFTPVAPSSDQADVSAKASVTIATALLVLALMCCVSAAIAMAALSAERVLTPNLPTAAMFASVPAGVGVVGFLGAFEVLANRYLPDVQMLMLLVAAAFSAVSVLFTAYAVADSWSIGPRDDREWLARQWLRTQAQAYLAGTRLLYLGAGPIAAGVVARLLDVPPASPAVMNWLVGVGIGMALLMTIASIRATEHPLDGSADSVSRRAAVTAVLAQGSYLSTLVVLLP